MKNALALFFVVFGKCFYGIGVNFGNRRVIVPTFFNETKREPTVADGRFVYCEVGFVLKYFGSAHESNKFWIAQV
jgi:hypothetical protein